MSDTSLEKEKKIVLEFIETVETQEISVKSLDELKQAIVNDVEQAKAYFAQR